MNLDHLVIVALIFATLVSMGAMMYFASEAKRWKSMTDAYKTAYEKVEESFKDQTKVIEGAFQLMDQMHQRNADTNREWYERAESIRKNFEDFVNETHKRS